MKPIIWGTAGHIDHGKTALIEALTGTNTDRLKEEQDRGLTIDIGFAFLSESISFIDVPGHERFVKNMVTGVSTIDAGLLVVAADDGIMPQTREHLAILQLLEVEAGCIAITKTDLVQEEWLELVEETVHELVQGTFLESASIIRTSAIESAGISELEQEILELSARLPRRLDRGIPRLPVDRAFSVKGFGTVVTGSVLAGEFHPGDEVELLPERRELKIRGIQTHGHETERVGIGERAALNLAGIGVEEIARGDQVAGPGMLQVSDEVYASVHILSMEEEPLKQNQRVRIHLGTTEILARCTVLSGKKIRPGQRGLLKLRMEEKAVVAFHDRYIMRFYSPMRTIGGGKVLFPSPVESVSGQQLRESLEQLGAAEIDEIIPGLHTIYKDRLLSLNEYSRELTLHPRHLRDPVQRLRENGILTEFTVDEGHSYLLTERVSVLKEEIVTRVRQYHNDRPKEPGYPGSQLIQELSIPEHTAGVLLQELTGTGTLMEEGPLVRLPDHEIALSESEQDQKMALVEFIRDAGLCPPSWNDLEEKFGMAPAELRQLLKILRYQKAVERLPNNLYLHRDYLDRFKSLLNEYFQQHSTLEVGDLKEMIGGSRKYAIPLLEYADQQGWTRRDGDVRYRQNL